MTRERLPPEQLDLIGPLRRYVPPAKVVDKPGYSPFYQSTLDTLLPAEGTLVISGTETDVCVASAVFDAIGRGLRVVIASDAVCSSADETHDAQMCLYRNRFSLQVEVAEVADILSAWR